MKKIRKFKWRKSIDSSSVVNQNIAISLSYEQAWHHWVETHNKIANEAVGAYAAKKKKKREKNEWIQMFAKL